MILKRKQDAGNQTARQLSPKVLKQLRGSQQFQLKTLKQNVALVQMSFAEQQNDFDMTGTSKDRYVWPELLVKSAANM